MTYPFNPLHYYGLPGASTRSVYARRLLYFLFGNLILIQVKGKNGGWGVGLLWRRHVKGGTCIGRRRTQEGDVKNPPNFPSASRTSWHWRQDIRYYLKIPSDSLGRRTGWMGVWGWGDTSTLRRNSSPTPDLGQSNCISIHLASVDTCGFVGCGMRRLDRQRVKREVKRFGRLTTTPGLRRIDPQTGVRSKTDGESRKEALGEPGGLLLKVL